MSQCELLYPSIVSLNLTCSSRVNAVETLYSAFPALMYIDPTLGAPLLEPLFRFQASPNYSVPFAAADLGTSHINTKAEMCRRFPVGSSYPNVTGSNSSHNQGVERPCLSYYFVRF